jgi:hypothetical protein
MCRNRRDRALARVCPRRGDYALRRAGPVVALLAGDNLETAAAPDLCSKREDDLVERYRRQRLILAWIRDKPTGTLQ